MEVLATTAAYIGVGTLLFTGYDHARHLARYQQLVQRQAIWPVGFEPAVVRLITAAEIALGLAAVALLLLEPSPFFLRPILLITSGLYLLYGSYGLWLLRQRPAAPCACSTLEHPTNIWVPIRAFSLAGLTLAGAVLTGELMRPAPSLAFFTVLLMSTGLGELIWLLPTAMHDPFHAAPQRRLRSTGMP
jgi:hypothetical protein